MTKLHLIVENRRARNYHDHQKYLQANRLPKESKHGPWMLVLFLILAFVASGAQW